MKNLMSCRRFARSVSGGSFAMGGPSYGRLYFWMHWMMCPFCRRFWREILVLGRIQRARVRQADPERARVAAVKARLKQRMIRGRP